MIQLPRFDAKSAAQKSDVDVVFVAQDPGKKPIPPRGPYGKAVERFRKGESFGAKLGEVLIIALGGQGGAISVAYVGIGPAAEATPEKTRQAAGHLVGKLAATKVESAQVQLDSLLEAKGISGGEELIAGFVEGWALSAYRFEKYKKTAKDEPVGPARVTFVAKDKRITSSLPGILADARIVAECVGVTRDWSNEPPNFGTPEYFAREAQRLSKEFGLSCKVLDEAACEREKMGLFIAVGIGSEREGKVVVVEYSPKGVKNPKTVALVGKGITFDSGGISIKPSMKMEEMKHDMTGAATMMGAVLLAARRKIRNRVVAILAFTENMPDGRATTPGAVIYGRAGKSVEIINTDAEGRLILADVLDYAHEFDPDVIVNAATLTGACGVALGKHCAGLMGNDSALTARMFQLSNEMNERVWELPLYDEYFEDLKSDVADMKNSANDPMGGTIRGGIFLKQFIRKGVPWCHLDIAYTAQAMGMIPYLPKKGASGMHVRTLARFAAEY
jgi:leucyl aminopeptidase